MSTPIKNLSDILRSMHPVLNPGTYVYALLPDGTEANGLHPIVTVREKEGVTLVLEETVAEQAGLDVLFRAAWITLHVHSGLQAVGLTAAFSTALGQANISCNVVAGAFHDHLFVPVEQVTAAMTVLEKMQMSAQGRAD